MPRNENGSGSKKGKVLDLNTKILIGIREELRELKAIVSEHTSILKDHTTILKDHTTILRDHSQHFIMLESGLKELARETHKWVAHFDRDYMRLANEFDGIRSRVERCEAKLYPSQ